MIPFDFLTGLSLGIVVGACLGLVVFALVHINHGKDDTERLDAIQAFGLRISCVDGAFGVIDNGRVIGIGFDKDVRVAIDGAIAHLSAMDEEV